jgi:hypothetical protein
MFIPKQINLVINGKAVGKSVFAANFVQYLNDRGISYPAIKSDSQRREIDRIFVVTETRDLLATDGRPSSTGVVIDCFDEVCLIEVPRLRHWHSWDQRAANRAGQMPRRCPNPSAIPDIRIGSR